MMEVAITRMSKRRNPYELFTRANPAEKRSSPPASLCA
ncbi:hypothetical protein J2Y91_003105 [Erwinia aphidicola]|nr:hypothetical protein [Erwinia aphidicola]